MNKQTPLYSVVIPTFNEAGNVGSLIHEIINIFEQQVKSRAFEIVVVDDNSQDGTQQVVEKISQKDDRVHLLVHAGKPELAGSILQGIKASRGAVVVGMDADFNHHPRFLIDLIKALDHADVVIGSRFIKNGGMADSWRYWLSWLVNLYFRVRYHFPIWDNTSGYYAIHRKKLQQLDLAYIYRGYGEYHLRLIAEAARRQYHLYEVPIYYYPRRYGTSKSKFWKMFVTYDAVASKSQRR